MSAPSRLPRVSKKLELNQHRCLDHFVDIHIPRSREVAVELMRAIGDARISDILPVVKEMSIAESLWARYNENQAEGWYWEQVGWLEEIGRMRKTRYSWETETGVLTDWHQS